MKKSKLDALSASAQMRLWAFANVPMLYGIRASITEIDEKKIVVSVPLLRRNRNHQNSMYIGVLVCGADIAGGFLAFRKSIDCNQPISFLFKDLKAEFLRRPESKTFFTCEDGEKIDGLLEKVQETGKRQHETVKIVATCPDKFGDEPVAIFYLTISVKKSDKKSKFLRLKEKLKI